MNQPIQKPTNPPASVLVSPPVLFAEEKLGSFTVATVTLNRGQVLNSLNTEAYHLLEPKLLSWEKRPDIAAVVIQSENQKAFCAGGDVKSLVLNIREKGVQAAHDFFTAEYFCDAILHSYKKPVLVLANGFAMGGGMGLFMGASHRLVTKDVTFAMPEMAIGLFPDVGGTEFLSRLPNHIGLFLGLTGARWGVGEAAEFQMCDGIYDSSKKRHVVVDLLRQDWSEDASFNHKILSGYIAARWPNKNEVTGSVAENDAESMLVEFREHFGLKMHELPLKEIDQKLRNISFIHPVLQDGAKRYKEASPTSVAVFYEAYKRHMGLNILEVIAREWDMALRFSEKSDFDEGVRALLIDKDQKPKWQPANLEEVLGQGAIERFFAPFENNPLRQKLLQFSRQAR